MLFMLDLKTYAPSEDALTMIFEDKDVEDALRVFSFHCMMLSLSHKVFN